MKMTDRIALILLGWICATSAFAQGTRADYERAGSLSKRVADKVFRDRIRPQWLAGNARFWYRVETGPRTHEFVMVEAEKGAKTPAFDHARLADALTSAGVKGARPDQLPIDRLEFDTSPSALRFSCEGKSWRFDLASYALSEAPADEKPRPSLSTDGAPRASRRTGPETAITFVNRTRGEVELFWLDAEGQRRSYGKVAAGEQQRQHTFAGHVWLVTDGAGRTLGVFEATETPITAQIDAGSPAREPGRDGSTRSDRPRRFGRSSGVSPDKHWRAFIRNSNVMVEDLARGGEQALSADGLEGDAYEERFYWSPDSKKLVVPRTKKGDERKVYLIESSPRDQLQPKLQSYDYLKPGDRVARTQPHLFHLAAPSTHSALSTNSAPSTNSALSTPSIASTSSIVSIVSTSSTASILSSRQIPITDALSSNPWSLTDIRWAPDSSRFTFLYNQRGHQVLRVVAVDAETGAARAIVDEKSPTFIDYAGKQFIEWLDETHELIWMSERDGWNHLYLYNSDTGEVKNQITRGEWVVRGVEAVDAGARQVWFRLGGIRAEQDPYFVHYARVNFDGTGLTILTGGDGTHAVEFSPDRRFLIDAWSRVNQPPVTELRRGDDGRLVCELERADASALPAAGWRAPEPFVAKGRDGKTDIYGVVFLPSHFDPKTSYPVVESIYAGPQSSFVPKRFSASSGEQAMAELGFIVVKIDGMGTSNRSKAFHDVCWKNLADAGLPDRIAWMRAAAAKYPAMDLARVGVYGGSAGGQSALGALLTHGDFYKVAVADCGCHDNRMDKIWWNELWMGWPVGPHYAEQSNVTLAPNLQGKLLLIVGELDKNVDPASTMQVVNALVKADKDFDLLIVPNTGHGAAGTPYGRRRQQDFLVRNLLGVEPRSR